MSVDPARVDLARQLSARLERLSVDSIWARRAGGLRGNLLRWLDAYDSAQAASGAASQDTAETDPQRLEALIMRGYDILTAAARQIEVPQNDR